MSSQILSRSLNAVTFVSTAQRYKAGRFTMPAKVLQHLRLDWNEWVALRLESRGGRPLWTGTLKMTSGPEIDRAELAPYVRAGRRIRVTASRPRRQGS